MGVAIVRVLNPIKRGGIGGMTNNPVKVWPLRHHLVDSVLGKRFTFLAEKIFNQSALLGLYCILPDRRFRPRLY